VQCLCSSSSSSSSSSLFLHLLFSILVRIPSTAAPVALSQRGALRSHSSSFSINFILQFVEPQIVRKGREEGKWGGRQKEKGNMSESSTLFRSGTIRCNATVTVRCVLYHCGVVQCAHPSSRPLTLVLEGGGWHPSSMQRFLPATNAWGGTDPGAQFKTSRPPSFRSDPE
jgi:hypothetical protein